MPLPGPGLAQLAALPKLNVASSILVPRSIYLNIKVKPPEKPESQQGEMESHSAILSKYKVTITNYRLIRYGVGHQVL